MKKVIGRLDRADFPEFELFDIKMKVDTGAYTSSIHCHHIQEKHQEDGTYIEFELLDPSHPEYQSKKIRTKQYKERKIKNSFGQSEKRFVIKTIITLFQTDYPIELSLSERSEMKYPILIGRKLLNKRFIVDTVKKDLSYKLKQK